MSGRGELTGASEALHVDIHEDTRPCQPGPLGVCPWVLQLLAIEAAAVARHVRETGCEGLREAHATLVMVLHEHAPSPTNGVLGVWCGCGWNTIGNDGGMDWFDHILDDVRTRRVALAAPAASPEACARCGHERIRHDGGVGGNACLWFDGDWCPCSRYQPATASAAATGEEE